MARKGTQQRNGVERHSSNHKKKVSDSDKNGWGKGSETKVYPGDELPKGNQPSSPTDRARKTAHVKGEDDIKKNSGNFQRKENQEIDEVLDVEESAASRINSMDCSSPSVETPSVTDENGKLPGIESGPEHTKSGFGPLLNGLRMKNMMQNLELSSNMVIGNLRASALSMLKVAGEWLERQGPLFDSLKTNIYTAREYVKLNIAKAYPVVLKWLLQFGNILLLLSMVWLDCTLRGMDSFLRLGTTSFFSVIWCSILSVIAMVGISKFLIVLAIAAFVGVFIGLILGLLIVALSGLVFLWFYGSFWTTVFVVIISGLAFMFNQERLTLLITTVYSTYCVWSYVGWLGLLLALNLSFISSDILIYFLKNNINRQRRSDRTSEHSAGMEGRPGFFNGDSFETGPGLSADRGPGIPSTSGTDSELTSEEEVVRLLSCADHYSVLGFSRHENVDVSVLKREYRKKAMLVHPDKNMGNEKAAEAFKKLQNAYEVLLDSLKRKAYDDELRKEDLLNYFRRFQSTSQKNGEHGFFASGFAHSEADGDDPFGESRRIACKRCGYFHLWVHTKKSKSQARWCQECKEFHQAKDGDGWVEQSSQPFLFGLLQKVDAPTAYVCADSKIYDATDWYICQGMRCPANSHKPSFHVNTSLASKHNTGKGSSSGQRSGRMPTPNMEETMTEEEFFEWLQNAVQSGVFDSYSAGTSTESPSAKAGNAPKSGGGGSSSGNKRKKKGRKQWLQLQERSVIFTNLNEGLRKWVEESFLCLESDVGNLPQTNRLPANMAVTLNTVFKSPLSDDIQLAASLTDVKRLFKLASKPSAIVRKISTTFCSRKQAFVGAVNQL
ncbi:unnamed protein product [Dovyalis caffra]|uniref:J domain-containing protein n=1 Tax=Dovyalis caffra TaxID=77055 RepID=A0AAV1QWV9_9ROSI|nr:unnamed protein product [Dovyalis caffra]